MTVSTERLVEVHRLAVAGRDAAIASDVGNRVSRVWLVRSRFADVIRLAELERTVELDRQVGHPDLESDTAMLERVRGKQRS
ncbi:hypothetical protein ACFQFC_40120 [Amorphoplanes digitatis]|uniref:Uncharacterized protein n=1 Tax=Actinoplanes digitatis TaxID=1868 RepID=A0A7W7MQ51_9ACTN|nr:hypothetical protein [Actinoplanes digitatis]MBB4762382.1 hypothetical protein [Actinoplanes digitatis]GID92496.1 hypothetical protein Adi01nite_19080 [Actinoplanes digitatis]